MSEPNFLYKSLYKCSFLRSLSQKFLFFTSYGQAKDNFLVDTSNLPDGIESDFSRPNIL